MKRLCCAAMSLLPAAWAGPAMAIPRPAPGAPPAPVAATTAWSSALPWVAGLVVLVILLAWWRSRPGGRK
jgi:hypothetical protein